MCEAVCDCATIYCRVRVQAKPLDIVYNPSTISRIKHFLTTPTDGRGTVHKLSQQIQSQTTAGLRNKLGDILDGETMVTILVVMDTCHRVAMTTGGWT